MVSVDLSHNALLDIVLQDDSGGCPTLTVLKLSHNPDCRFVLDFARFPKITHVDLCATQAIHPFPLPTSIVDFILASPELQPHGKGTAAKIFATDVGYSETIGVRAAMEDALVLISGTRWRVYVVIDGHGGATTAHLIGRYWAGTMAAINFRVLTDITKLCVRLQQLLLKKKVQDGACFAAVLICQRKLCVAHLGDCRVLRVLTDGTVVQLTTDHKANERKEMELVKKNESFVSNGRVEGHLAVSRSLGDFATRGIVRTPDVSMFDLDEDDWRLVIGCDGVFDVLDNGLVTQIVMEEPDVHRAAAIIKHVVIASRSLDNVSVVVIDSSQQT
jgi:serine/threonine protein phosphatase PrpC